MSPDLDQKLDSTLAKVYRKRHLAAALNWIRRSWRCFRGDHAITGTVREGAMYWHCRACGKELYK